MSFEITGKLKLIMDEQRFDSGFYKREFVVTTQEQYPQDLKFELFKEKCEMIQNFNIGDPISVKFDVRGREWNGNYYVNLNAWRIDAPSGAAPAAQGGAPAAAAPLPTSAPIDLSGDDDDDLPF